MRAKREGEDSVALTPSSCSFNNARERTLADFDALLAQARMRISTVYLTRSYVVVIVATPV